MIINKLADKLNKGKRAELEAMKKRGAIIGVTVAIGAGVIGAVIIAASLKKKKRSKMLKKAGDAAEGLKDKVFHNVENVKHMADVSEDKAYKVIDRVQDKADTVIKVVEDAHAKTEGVIKDIKDSGREIKKDIRETAEDIAEKLKPEKEHK